MTDLPRTTVPATQITHNDLDGYGCSTVVGLTVLVERVEHVTRYADVAPVFEGEIERLRASDTPELLVVTDIAVEPGFAAGISAFAEMNLGRSSPHLLVVIDHHASSREVLAGAGFTGRGSAGATTTLTLHHPPTHDTGSNPWAAPVLVLVDHSRSATGLCMDHAWLLADRAPLGPHDDDLALLPSLVEAVDAVDLWDRARPAFDAGEAMNEGFWETVETYVPAGHELHDAFVSRILLRTAERIGQGDLAYAVEAAANGIRRDAVSWLLQATGTDEDTAQRHRTTRMRVARALAASDRLLVQPVEGMSLRLCFAIDAGVFQRVADFILDEGQAAVVVNVRRGGAMMFRSRNGEALDLAKRFGGGGHRNSAGARLASDAVFSQAEAVRQFREILAAEPSPAGTTWQA